MRKAFGRRPSPAMVVAILALIAALAGTAVAGGVLNKKKVNNIITNRAPGLSVSHAKTADAATSAKTADTATSAKTADSATNLPTPENWHEVGAAGEPAFQIGYANSGGSFETVAFYKDPEGVVHLKGSATGAGPAVIFQLPVGYRPANAKELQIAAVCGCGTTDSPTGDQVNLPTGKLLIFGDVGTASLNGALEMSGTSSFVALDGVTFRAAG